MSLRLYRPFDLAILLTLALSLCACGRKTAPKPIVPKAPPRVESVNADVEGGTVRLQWKIPPELGDTPLSDFTFVVRAETLDKADAECADCPPRNVEVLARIDPAAQGPWSVQDGTVEWIDASFPEKKARRYWIDLYDRNGDLVSTSPAVRVAAHEKPPRLRSLTVAAEPRGLLLHWNDGSGKSGPRPSSGGFVIQRRLKGGEWRPAAADPVQGNSYLDTDVAPQKEYQYRVRPFVKVLDARIWGDWKESASITAPARITPPPPESVWAIPSGGILEIYWTESDVPVQGYHVYRRDGKTITRLTVDPIRKPPFVDKKVQPNHVYFYAVSAVGSDESHQEGLLSKWFEVRNVQFQ